MEKVVERFIRYVKECTTSDPDSTTCPSTFSQVEFMKNLEAELRTIGLKEIEHNNYRYLTATIPANGLENCPVVGFIAHIDTSPNFKGENVNPQIIENYDGGVIKLNGGVEINPAESPELLNYTGQSIITTDGTTLLGADDKAGVAEIVTVSENLMRNDKIKHGKIRIGFTVDEEIGKSTDLFDIKKFGADFAYTIDGGGLGELEFENFNAASAKIIISGQSVHPGYAKNKMINALLIAHKIVSMLPPAQRPEHTEKYEGFFHLDSLNGNVDKAVMQLIIRDHDFEKFETRKKLLKEVVEFINLEFEKELVELDLKDSYYNMREKIEPVMYIVEIAKTAMEQAGVTPTIKAIRGGTDGARLSHEGLPCPNIFTGGHNFHSPLEFLPIPSMFKSMEVILNIVQLVGKFR
ncbi:MAG: peptidase T [Bacteroidales bacterium]|jgi:tripeptide aminopeptidase|nr:peptidase T [Bacteroidales bacterium]